MSGIRKGFVQVGAREVHYRTSGSGPLVVLLHDSPRSSALHLPLLTGLADKFTVLAFDTPGNGASSPLPGSGIVIPDLSNALLETLDVLGVERAGFYGTHTSSKILLDFAVRAPERVSVAILDGLSIPEGGPDPVYIGKYMRPFEIDDDGAYIGREWTRLRDQGRWFPWYSREPGHRTVSEPSPAVQAHQAAIDYFSSGPNYVAPYTAAMNYWAASILPNLKVPTYIVARSDDVLYSHLERLPALPACCHVERLTTDRTAWEARVRSILLEYAHSAPDAALQVEPKDGDPAAGPRSGYVAVAGGQMRTRRYGGRTGRPIVYLPEIPGGAGGSADVLQALSEDGRPVLALDLPGYGLSDPLEAPTADAYAQAVIAAIDSLGSEPVDLIAEFTSTPLALRVMATAPNKIHRCVLDGVLLADEALLARLRSDYCPALRFDTSGAHLHRAWHMLRDLEIQWPWFDGSQAAARRGVVKIDGRTLHSKLLEVASQMDRYGDACQAAFGARARDDVASVQAKVLVTAGEDPRLVWSREAAALSQNVEVAERGETAPLRAAHYLQFFDRP